MCSEILNPKNPVPQRGADSFISEKEEEMMEIQGWNMFCRLHEKGALPGYVWKSTLKDRCSPCLSLHHFYI